MEITIKTLTPIWTGGVETGRMDRIHETGIIGSLRWWYEVIVRGLGGSACDPTAHSCIYTPDKQNQGLCDVCRIFGATGWRRRFRLTIKDSTISPASITHPMKAGRSYIDQRGNSRTPTWYFPNSAQTGKFAVLIQSLYPNFSQELIADLIHFVADWAAIGARPQMGFGVIELEQNHPHSNQLRQLIFSSSNYNPGSSLPSLQNLFFARVQKQHASEQDTFNLKYDLRRLFATDKNLRHFVMGTVQNERIAAKVHMSRPYNDGCIRVWGWLPENAREFQGVWNREAVLNAVKSHLSTQYSLQVWREFSSQRDTVDRFSNIHLYLNSLLG
jgi:CRISPR-associated protein Cmr1